MANKLPIFKTVGDAFRMALWLPVVHTGFFFTYLLMVLVFFQVLSFLAVFFQIYYDPVFQLIDRMMWLPILAPFAVSIHRHIILHETLPAPRRLFQSIFTKRNATFAGYWVVIALPSYFIGFFMLRSIFGPPIRLVFLGLLQISVAMVIAGIIILLPFIAVDNKQTFARCWAKTRGNILRVFAIILIIGAVTMLVAWLFIDPLELIFSVVSSDAFLIVRIFLIEAVGIAFLLIATAWAVAAVSHVFVFLSEGGEDKNTVIPLNGETPAADERRTKWRASLTRWIWMGGSGVATWVGADWALSLFPGVELFVSDAGGSTVQSNVGQFSWHLVGFALAVGLPFAIFQCLILLYVPRYREALNTLVLALWIPVTSIGIAVMILPLHWFDAMLFFMQPWLIVSPMLPGMLFLGVAQWFILYQAISARGTWVLRTVIGAVIGSLVGFVAGFFMSDSDWAFASTWAFMIGAGIGVLQGNALVKDLDTDLRRQEQPS
jgi:hypothetical protein